MTSTQRYDVNNTRLRQQVAASQTPVFSVNYGYFSIYLFLSVHFEYFSLYLFYQFFTVNLQSCLPLSNIFNGK